MSSRLDTTLRKYPEHEEGIRLLATLDPSKNLKYIEWGAGMLAAGQAVAHEISDVVALFHRFNGQVYGKRRDQRIARDIYTYRPEDLARLRDNLLKIKRKADRKQRERERLYHIEGPIEADVVYDSEDLVVRHIKNKNASVHYGLDTKWCISMNQEGYFEDYDTMNATFFFFERKKPLKDEFDKVAVMVPRDNEQAGWTEAFTTLDHRVDMMALARVHGSRVFDIFREIHERSEAHPPSAMFQLHAGRATQEQIEAIFTHVTERKRAPHEIRMTAEAICCNDNAPQTLLEELGRNAGKLLSAACRRSGAHKKSRVERSTVKLTRAIAAARVIHPNTPHDIREKLIKELRRQHVTIDSIRRSNERPLHVDYTVNGRNAHGRLQSCRRGRRLRHTRTVKGLIARAKMLERHAARARKTAKTLERKLAAKAKNKAARAARKKQPSRRREHR